MKKTGSWIFACGIILFVAWVLSFLIVDFKGIEPYMSLFLFTIGPLFLVYLMLVGIRKEESGRICDILDVAKLGHLYLALVVDTDAKCLVIVSAIDPSGDKRFVKMREELKDLKSGQQFLLKKDNNDKLVVAQVFHTDVEVI